MNPSLEVDHFLIACADLASGCAYVEQLFGCAPQAGGSHPGVGTCNALLALENDVYLEIIAPDPAQPADLRFAKRLLGVSQPTLMWWSVRCENMDTLQILAKQREVEVLARQPGSRTTSDGRELNWDLLFADAARLGALLPFYIHWQHMELHPSRSSPVAGELLKVELSHCDDSIADLLPGSVSEQPRSERAHLRAVFKVAGKTISLQSPDDFVPGIGRIMA